MVGIQCTLHGTVSFYNALNFYYFLNPFRASAEDLVVRTGATSYEVGGHFWPVQSLKTHPLFRTNNAADLTLIEIALDIVENNATKIIPVATIEPAVGTLARVSGWGSVAVSSFFNYSIALYS